MVRWVKPILRPVGFQPALTLLRCSAAAARYASAGVKPGCGSAGPSEVRGAPAPGRPSRRARSTTSTQVAAPSGSAQRGSPAPPELLGGVAPAAPAFVTKEGITMFGELVIVVVLTVGASLRP